MAKYDHGGGCSCGLQKECNCGGSDRKEAIVETRCVSKRGRNILPNVLVGKVLQLSYAEKGDLLVAEDGVMECEQVRIPVSTFIPTEVLIKKADFNKMLYEASERAAWLGYRASVGPTADGQPRSNYSHVSPTLIADYLETNKQETPMSEAPTLPAAEKTQLTSEECVKVYVANRIHNVHQDVLAMLFNVNSGRISEAVTAIEWAANNIKVAYNVATNKSQVLP